MFENLKLRRFRSPRRMKQYAIRIDSKDGNHYYLDKIGYHISTSEGWQKGFNDNRYTTTSIGSARRFIKRVFPNEDTSNFRIIQVG